MKTGLTKKQKTTDVYYNAKDPLAEVSGGKRKDWLVGAEGFEPSLRREVAAFCRLNYAPIGWAELPLLRPLGGLCQEGCRRFTPRVFNRGQYSRGF